MSNRISFAFALFLPLVAAVACGGGEKTTEIPPAADTGALGGRAAPDTSKFTASLTGKAMFEGTAPVPQKIQMSADPFCASNAQAGATAEDILVNGDGTLKNVIVYVKSGAEGMNFPAPSEPIVIDQQKCKYDPHVFTMMVNQPLKIKNSDSTLHNIHAFAVTNTPFNIGQPVQNMETTKVFDKPEMPLPIRCDVHKWMSAFAGVFTHPFHTVTRDAGTFELKLPPGKYEIVAWHEKLGTQTQTVEVADNDKKELTFSFKETKTE